MEEFKVTLQRNVIQSATLTIIANDSADAEARANEMLGDFSANIAWNSGVVDSESVVDVTRTSFRYWVVGLFNDTGDTEQSLIHQNKYSSLVAFSARDYDDAVCSVNGKDSSMLAMMSARATAELCGKLDDLCFFIIDEAGHILAKEDVNMGDGYFVKM